MTTKKIVPKKRVAVVTGGANKKSDPHQPAAIPLIMYRRIALTFIILVVCALLAVLYLSTVQAVIHVESTQAQVTTEFVANVFATPTRETDVHGQVLSGSLGKTQSFTSTGTSSKTIEDIATGTVTIYNNLSFTQALVATTRLLSQEGVLFRLKSAVIVPSGGSVEAQVYADQPGASGDIKPTRFTIPGLSRVRRESVYAQSSEAFTGGVSTIAIVSQEEMDAAVLTLQETLLNDAKEMLVAEADETFSGASYDSEIVEQTFSIEPGTEVKAFDLTLTIKVTAVFYDKQALEKIAIAKLYEGLGQGQEFVQVDPGTMVVAVDGVNQERQEANIHVTLSAPAITSQTSEALHVARFVGMTEEEIRDLLLAEGVATDVQVDFFPFWVHTVPRLKDHIYIDIR